jgi:tartrate dehydratase alpha subunit/fumarate hydratase class I-like protein
VVGDDHAAVSRGVVEMNQLGGGGVGGDVTLGGVSVKLKERHGMILSQFLW